MLPTTTDIERALTEFSLLSGATPPQLKRLAGAGSLRGLVAGETLIRQGDFGSSVYFVLSGSLVVKLRRFDSSEAVLAVITRGVTVGELSLAGDRPRSSTVIANDACSVFELERDAFAKVLARNEAVVKNLDRAYRRTAIAANLYADPLFSELPSEAVAELVEKAHMEAFEKDDVIVEEGEDGDAFYIIWSGHVRITRRLRAGGERTVSYVSEGDYFGEVALVERRRRTASVIANDHAELIRIDRALFEEVIGSNTSVMAALRKRIVERSRQAERVMGSETRAVFIEDMVKLGAGFASNALIIRLDLCTRCGACSSACHELYGNSRLTRRGKTFVMPETHESILMPNSCWHCKDPECMIGCPTDALRRSASGEIQVLEDRCIGCEICANRCPWGNITMADVEPDTGGWLRRLVARLAGRKPRRAVVTPAGKKASAKAVKCDLCEGQSASACVMACPYGAIDRIDPNITLQRAMEL